MRNILDILKDAGVEIPEDKLEAFKKAVAENYKTIAEHEKKVGKAEQERDSWKERAESAEATLKGFEGVDVEKIKGDLEAWKKKAEDAEKEFSAKLEQRDFDDALRASMDDIKFSSEAAKRAVMAEVKDAGLKLKDGKIMGLNDLIENIKGKDASAFVDEGNPPARFSAPLGKPKGTYKSKADIMAIKDSAERQAAIAANLSLFERK